jgi:hypothetical protein
LGEVAFAQFWTVHTYRILPNVYNRSYAMLFKQRQEFVGLPTAIAKGKKIRFLGGSRLIPFGLTCNLLLDGRAWQIEPVCLWHGPS